MAEFDVLMAGDLIMYLTVTFTVLTGANLASSRCPSEAGAVFILLLWMGLQRHREVHSLSTGTAWTYVSLITSLCCPFRTFISKCLHFLKIQPGYFPKKARQSPVEIEPHST